MKETYINLSVFKHMQTVSCRIKITLEGLQFIIQQSELQLGSYFK